MGSKLGCMRSIDYQVSVEINCSLVCQEKCVGQKISLTYVWVPRMILCTE